MTSEFLKKIGPSEWSAAERAGDHTACLENVTGSDRMWLNTVVQAREFSSNGLGYHRGHETEGDLRFGGKKGYWVPPRSGRFSSSTLNRFGRFFSRSLCEPL